MIEFLKAQPASYHAQVMDLLSREAVQMAVMISFDYATTPLRLSNRNVPFTDLKWGYEWGAGGGLLVGLPEVTGGDGELAPFREYQLGIPDEWVDAEDWAAKVVQMVSDVGEYRGREAAMYGQLFNTESNQPVGHPFVFDTGIMDRMAVSFQVGGVVVSLTTESFLARKGAPVYGMQTYFDQKRRYPTDEGFQFTTEAGKIITWTDW